jgi:hypothetical protein
VFLERDSVATTTTPSRPPTTPDPVKLTRRWARRAPAPHWLALGAILAAGLFVRVWQINALGFNTDEAVYAGQGASIAGDSELEPYFPVFRAHPLLFQTILSVAYQFGTSDVVGRLIAVAFGLATILVVYKAGELLYGRRAGLLAAMIIALMPYHVVVTRQVLLDGPLTFWSAVTLYLVARYVHTRRVAWLYAAGAGFGLACLSKETAILLIGSLFVFFALTPSLRIRSREFLITVGIVVLTILPFPLALILSGYSRSGGEFLAWQLFRRSNHGLDFYLLQVPPAMGYLVVVLAIGGLWFLRARRSWRETLLLSWILVPAAFFEIWPVKGYQYLLPAAVPVALLAARTLDWLTSGEAFSGRRMRQPSQGEAGAARLRRWAVPAAVAIVAASLLIPTLRKVQPSDSTQFLAGSGGVPGGREAGRWVAANVPTGGSLMTVGPSMANIIQFYGHRKAYGLSVSTNPLNRNPTYEPIKNPDLSIRANDLQYVVWDAFSASRSPFFGDRLLGYAKRYHGRAVHTEWVTSGSVREPVIRIFEVRP